MEDKCFLLYEIKIHDLLSFDLLRVCELHEDNYKLSKISPAQAGHSCHSLLHLSYISEYHHKLTNITE